MGLMYAEQIFLSQSERSSKKPTCSRSIISFIQIHYTLLSLDTIQGNREVITQMLRMEEARGKRKRSYLYRGVRRRDDIFQILGYDFGIYCNSVIDTCEPSNEHENGKYITLSRVTRFIV